MLYTPDSHLSQQIDELKGHWFDRYRPICDPTLRSGHHRVLMVTAITISSLRTVKNIIERTHKFPYNILFTFVMDRGRAPNGIGHLMILLILFD